MRTAPSTSRAPLKTILALDLGPSCGWALRAGDVIVSGVWDLRPDKFSGAAMRYLKFTDKLDELHRASPIDVVYYEGVRAHKGVDAAHIYGGLMATLQTWCEHRTIPYEGVPVAAIKKHVSGKGNATKELMIAAMEERGFRPCNSDEADALALLLCGERCDNFNGLDGVGVPA